MSASTLLANLRVAQSILTLAGAAGLDVNSVSIDNYAGDGTITVHLPVGASPDHFAAMTGITVAEAYDLADAETAPPFRKVGGSFQKADVDVFGTIPAEVTR